MSPLIFLFPLIQVISCSDITNAVFGTVTDGMPAAFGDFNSDELTDVFVIRDNQRTVEVLLAAEEEPLLRPARISCNFPGQHITSVVPGDFDGDAFMDIMITARKADKNEDHQKVYLLWGGLTSINCTTTHLIEVVGQPLAIDYNQDMISDLFGMKDKETRAYWIFDNSRGQPTEMIVKNSKGKKIFTA